LWPLYNIDGKLWANYFPMENDRKKELYMIGYVAGVSSEVPSNVSVRIARKISQLHQTIEMGAICVRLRSNLMLDSTFSGNFTPKSCNLTLSSITFYF
jgi:hypothetical protein